MENRAGSVPGRISTTVQVFACFLAALFTTPVSVSANTVITNHIEADTRWSKAESPYIINNHIWISPDATVVVEPGVVVKFKRGANIYIEGTFLVGQENSEKVVFTSFYDDAIEPGADDQEFCWEEQAEGGTLETRCEIRDAGDPTSNDWSGLYFTHSDNSIFHNVELYYSRTAISLLLSTLYAENITIDHSRTGIDMYLQSSLDLKNADIVCERDGIIVSSEAVLNTTGANINCGRVGLSAYDEAVVRLDTVKVHGALYAGLLAFDNRTTGTINVTNSEFTENVYGMLVFNTNITAHNNHIHGNDFGVEAFNPLVPNQFDFSNNYWGDPTGPYDYSRNQTGLGDGVSEFVLYEPWLGQYPPEPEVTCCSSVLFIPGLQASRLYVDEDGDERQVWEPGGNGDVEKLHLSTGGESLNQVYTKDIIDEANVVPIFRPKIYASFIDMMEEMVQEETIAAWEALPYDWRFSVDDIVKNGVRYRNEVVSMKDTVQRLAQGSKSGKVTIVTHSNGGLVAKALLKELEADGGADKVDSLIMVAAPQLGTPLVVPAMLHGYDQSLGLGLILKKSTARTLAENALGVYGLLPSEKYFETVTDPVVVFDESLSDVNNFYTTYGESIDSKSELDEFLRGVDGRVEPEDTDIDEANVLKQSLLQRADDLHTDLDNWQPPEGVQVIQVAGWGVDTVKGVRYLAKYPCGKLLTVLATCKPELDFEPIFTKEGDKTVVYPSAVAMDGGKYFIDLLSYNKETRPRVGHKDLFESTAVHDFLKNILTENDTLPIYVSGTKPVTENQSMRISVHSPVSIDMYDEENNHTGVVETEDGATYIEENIPNSYYLEFGEGKYVGTPADFAGTIDLNGTGAGTFTVRIEHVSNDSTIKTELFTDIPVTSFTKAGIVFDDAQTTLTLDSDGDGAVDFELAPASDVDPVLFLEMMRKTILSLGLPKHVEKQLLGKIDQALKFVTKAKKKDITQLIKKYSGEMVSKKLKKSKDVTQEQKDAIVEMFNKFLDSIK